MQGTGATITGNLIGIGADGATVLGNGADGLGLTPTATGAIVGGATPADRNVIGGNIENGIDDQVGASIVGNYIGVAADGTTPTPNDIGISLGGSATGAVIGRAGAEGNVVSGNTGSGILDASDGAVLRGNLIGVASDGLTPAPNSRGIFTTGTNTVIGGTAVGDANTISANTTGIWLDGTDVLVEGNLIGTDATGTVGVGNTSMGIDVVGSAVTIGGATPGAGNVIVDSTFDGIRIFGDDVTILGNIIGADVTGSVAIPNGRHGVSLRGTASAVTVGGIAVGEGNLVANNSSIGVMSQAPGDELTVLGNDIHTNGGLGIDQGFDGVTPNDAPDADGVVNFPVITNVQRVATELIVDVELDVPAGDQRIELFANTTADGSGHGEGESFVGGATVSHTGTGVETFQITVTAPATILSATTTEDLGAGAFGATSEFSLGVPSPDLVIVNSTGDNGDALVGDGRCDTGGVNADGDPECTYRAAIEEANDPAGAVDAIWFAIPTTDAGHNAGVWTISPPTALPQVTAPITIDGATQPGYVANTAPAPLPLDSLPVIEIDGADLGDGVHLASGAAGSTINALVIGGFVVSGGHGIEVRADDVTITGSVIGLRADGLTDNPMAYGVWIENAARTTIGGTTPASRNLIAGSNNGQITTNPGTDTQILGNIIGAGATTLTVPGSWGTGIQAWNGSDIRIGSIAAPNVIAGGSSDWGIEGGADDVIVEGNLIGTDATYTADLGNWQAISAAGDRMVITDNVIGNFDEGIAIGADDAVIARNSLGTDPTGTVDLGHVDFGIRVWGGDRAVIGGLTSTDANLIAFNGGAGIEIGSTIDDPTILINRIWDSGGLGIDHDADGPSVNDAGDADGLPNAPTLLSAISRNGITELEFGLDAAAGTYRIDVYANPSGVDPSGFGEGEVHVDTFDLVHPGGSRNFVRTIAGSETAGLSAVATHPSQATSEFSNTITSVDADAATTLDASERRSDLIRLNGVSVDQPGLVGSAVDIASGGRLIGPALDLTSDSLTLTAVVDADALTGNHSIVSKLDASGNVVYELGVDGTTSEAVATVRLGGSPVTVRGGSISADTWHRLVASWDGAALVLMVDGAEVGRVAAVGTLATDPTTDLTIGNRSDLTRPFDGRIDHVAIRHTPMSTEQALAQQRLTTDSSSHITVGSEQRSTPGEWTVTSDRSRSGGFSLEAPGTAGADAPAWAVATDIDEPGVVFESYWWFDIAAPVDLAAGTRTGSTPTEQYETALSGGSGWQLRQRIGSTETTDTAPDGNPEAGRWVNVEIWTDQLGRSRVVIDGDEVTSWTDQGDGLASGSVGLRVGELHPGNAWFVDDPRARRLVIPEPVTSLAPIDRN